MKTPLGIRFSEVVFSKKNFFLICKISFFAILKNQIPIQRFVFWHLGKNFSKLGLLRLFIEFGYVKQSDKIKFTR
jgi:hypothetical protein